MKLCSGYILKMEPYEKYADGLSGCEDERKNGFKNDSEICDLSSKKGEVAIFWDGKGCKESSMGTREEA